ncbi:MAG: threonine/serine dehydratase [Alicyclobacillus sp.]|nr:threonine/serine dehydratase [Alicyclobacillus sp.]
MNESQPLTISDVMAAQKRIHGRVEQTPLLPAPALSAVAGADVYLKCENLQRTGSFKLRGATNKLLALQEQPGDVPGVITASSGNHGQAVAYAAQSLGMPCTVVVPETVLAVKEAAIRAYGARVIRCGTMSKHRIELAEQLAEKEGLVFVPPYDDPDVAAGQGTIGLEILAQLPEVASVVVPVGGGGLISGIATAIKGRAPHVRVIGVEPETANDTYQSFYAGRVIEIQGTDTIADGLRTSHPGHYTFPLVQAHVDEITLVSEDAIIGAFGQLLGIAKLLVEPSGCVSAAAVLSRSTAVQGPVVCVLSGGNVDLSWVARVIV